MVTIVSELQLAPLRFLGENKAPLDSWNLDVRIEDSISGNVQIVAFCDPLLTEILGELFIP